MPDGPRVLRVHVDGQWAAADWAELMSIVDELYSDFALVNVIGQLVGKQPHPSMDAQITARVQQLKSILLEQSDYHGRLFLQTDTFSLERDLNIAVPVILQVNSIRYGSEGWADFFGAGTVAEQLQKMLDSIISIPERIANAIKTGAEGKKIKAEASQAEMDAQAQAVRNMNEAAETMRRAGIPEPEIQQFLRITSVEIFKLRKYATKGQLPKPPEMKALPAPKPA